MKHVGYFVVGDGKFGMFEYGQTFLSLEDGNFEYWENRGYEFVKVFVEVSN
jgi:hypothetical protein